MNSVFERAEVERELSAATGEVLETMFFTTIEETGIAETGIEETAIDEVEPRGGGRVGASVAFHGASEGRLAISLDRGSVEGLAAGFFGASVATFATGPGGQLRTATQTP